MANDNNEMKDLMPDRDAVIVRTSIIGILTNVFLAAFKAAVGFFSNSIAVTLDAVNNLSDAPWSSRSRRSSIPKRQIIPSFLC